MSQRKRPAPATLSIKVHRAGMSHNGSDRPGKPLRAQLGDIGLSTWSDFRVQILTHHSTGAVMSVITLLQASTIIDVALKKARENNLAPLTVAVLDAGGHLVAFKREDRSGILRFDIAFGKAWGALGMGFGSRTLASRAAKTPQFFTMLAAASGGRMVTNPGGVLIRDASGNVIGACGISGDTSDKDEMCALAGIEAAGLKADPGMD
jgi:uncharacterized protein GlcG (DUF336 family)